MLKIMNFILAFASLLLTAQVLGDSTLDQEELEVTSSNNAKLFYDVAVLADCFLSEEKHKERRAILTKTLLSLPQNICATKQPGFYANVDASCQRYFICLPENSIELECPKGYAFDQSACECRNSRKSPCCSDVSASKKCPLKTVPHDGPEVSWRKKDAKREMCSKKGEGWFPDVSTGCETFFHCKNRDDRHPIPITCPDGMMFSSESCSCVGVASPEATCNEDVPFEPCHIPEFDGCRNLVPGFYASYMHGCERYFICSPFSDETYFFDCPKGQKFNTETCTCESQVNVNCTRCSALKVCYGNETATAAPPPPTTSPAPPPDVCSGKSTALYPYYDSDCQCYYGCVHGVDYSYNYMCPPYFHFDIRTCSCKPLYLASCSPSDEIHGCIPKPPATTTTLKPPTTPYSNFCADKGPGYYADLNRHCEWFFVCDGSSPNTYQFDCPSTLRFNHFTCECDYSDAVPCTVFDATPCWPKTTSSSTSTSTPNTAFSVSTPNPEFFCEGKDPGFYMDETENCNFYYLCVADNPRPYVFHCNRQQGVNVTRGKL